MDKWTVVNHEPDRENGWLVERGDCDVMCFDLTEPEARAIAASRENAKAAEKVEKMREVIQDLLQWFDHTDPNCDCHECRVARAARALLEDDDGGS